MSKCSKTCNEIKRLIDSVSGLDDDYIYNKLLKLKSITKETVNDINKYVAEDELNGTIFKGRVLKI